MTISQANYLDLGNLLVNEVVGSVVLVSLLAVAGIAYFGVKNRLPVIAIVALCMMALSVVSALVTEKYFIALILVFVGLGLYTWLPKALKS